MTKLIGLDWVDINVNDSSQKIIDQDKVNIYQCDVHKTPFSTESFDTVVDTFGLECCYDIEQAYKEMKRVTKKGGKIILLERGKSVWQSDNLELMRKASLNLGARG